MLDCRTESNAKSLIKEADLIFLCGGHLPTQNNFFNNINLKEFIKNTNGLIIGGSAGAMNMAEDVLCLPELEGESLDPSFPKNLNGLGLTEINILPHYDDFKDFVLDKKDYIKDIVLPRSYENKIYALNNNSYILFDEKYYVYGEAYLIYNGKVNKINGDGEVKVLI